MEIKGDLIVKNQTRTPFPRSLKKAGALKLVLKKPREDLSPIRLHIPFKYLFFYFYHHYITHITLSHFLSIQFKISFNSTVFLPNRVKVWERIRASTFISSSFGSFWISVRDRKEGSCEGSELSAYLRRRKILEIPTPFISSMLKTLLIGLLWGTLIALLQRRILSCLAQAV